MMMTTFKAHVGKFQRSDERTIIDRIRHWSLKFFEDELTQRPSLHRYVKTLPKDVIADIDKLRYSTQIKQNICSQFDGNCDITPLPSTDEFYISHYNMDKGGDQGLFDKHYDGNLRFIKNATVVRVLIYISSDDDYVVHFMDSNLSKNFKTYEYGILDFHRELHWVEGTFDASDTPRILLKCNYLVCPSCSAPFRSFNIWLNQTVFFIVKTCMEYSKSPKTPVQYFVGFLCNFFRKINIVHPSLSFACAAVIIVAIGWVAVKFVKWMWLHIPKMSSLYSPRSTWRAMSSVQS
jgi:hypothetical protein